MFVFLDPGELVDGDLRLRCVATRQPDDRAVEAPTYEFALSLAAHPDTTIGFINLRVGDTPNLVLYRGHIGYGVDPAYRGQHYASRACQLLRPLARRHGLTPLWITCDPHNLASRRTCERIGAELIAIVDVPADAPAYHHGARRKCRYRLDP